MYISNERIQPVAMCEDKCKQMIRGLLSHLNNQTPKTTEVHFANC